MQWNDRMVIKWLKFHLLEWQLVLLGWWDESDRPQNLIGIRYIFLSAIWQPKNQTERPVEFEQITFRFVWNAVMHWATLLYNCS